MACKSLFSCLSNRFRIGPGPLFTSVCKFRLRNTPGHENDYLVRLTLSLCSIMLLQATTRIRNRPPTHLVARQLARQRPQVTKRLTTASLDAEHLVEELPTKT